MHFNFNSAGQHHTVTTMALNYCNMFNATWATHLHNNNHITEGLQCGWVLPASQDILVNFPFKTQNQMFPLRAMPTNIDTAHHKICHSRGHKRKSKQSETRFAGN